MSSHTHSHGPDSGHAHEHEHDFAAANAEHFNAEAEKYDDPKKVEIVQRLLPGILGAFPFDKEKTLVLDYACGTGLVSRALIPNTKKIVGVDISQGMVDQFNARIKDQGLSPEQAHAVVASLKGEPGELDDQKFDVAICSMAYHHIASITDTTATLARFLAPGGVLLVIDIIPRAHEDPTDPLFEEKYHAMVAHRHGFDEATMRSTFEGAGLVDFEYGKTADMSYGGRDMELFLARGWKA